MIARRTDGILGDDESVVLQRDYKSRARGTGGQKWDKTFGINTLQQRPSSWHPGLPSFQELLSTVEVTLSPDTESNQRAISARNSTLSTSKRFQHESGVVTRAIFNNTDGIPFQPSVNYPYAQYPDPNYAVYPSYSILSAPETYNPAPRVHSRMPSPNSAQRYINLNQVSAPSPNSVQTSRGHKIWHEAVQHFPLNGKITLTKAGKPRKRLEKACDTCRKKKVSVLYSIFCMTLTSYLGEMSPASPKVHTMPKKRLPMQC